LTYDNAGIFPIRREAMVSFSAANQIRLAMKMRLSHYGWYLSSRVAPTKGGDDYEIIVNVRRLDDKVRKVISPVVDGVYVKVEAGNK
jgi:hypothetical protein